MDDLVRPPRVRSSAFASSQSWLAAISLMILCIAAGMWGYSTEDAGRQNPLDAVSYFWLPMLVLVSIVASLGRRPIAILTAVALLDLEAALLGPGPQVALPFVVAVPLIGVAVAARLVNPSRLLIPYLAAWVSSSTGVTLAALQAIAAGAAPSTVAVIPGFIIVDALALTMLWQLDAGRLRALRAAAEAEARVRDLLDGVDLIGTHVDPDGALDFINAYGLRLTGWTRDEAIGANWWDNFASPDRREDARARWARIMSGRLAMEQQRESTIVTRSGEVRLIRWSHVTRHDADGRVAGVASLGEDVTAIRATEDAARRGAEMLATLVVSSPLPTIVLGLDRRVQLWNPAAAELVGWSEAEVIGKPIPAALYQQDRWAIGRTFARVRKGRPTNHELVELRRRDGQVVCVRLYGGVLLDGDGKPMSVGLQAIDVTQSLAIEEQLREAQKMEAVGRLAGGVAHDFNNSLTAIGGFAALIASGSKEPETREAAETILGAAKRAADLTRELLAYSRRSLLQPQVIDVNTLVASIRPMLLRLLGEDVSVAIETRVSDAMVRVDPGGMERVILNLAANARDAMPAGGRLTISTSRMVDDGPRGSAGRRWIVVSVADTGAGIPLELHSQVFDPFFTTKPVGSGTGLGLAMVKGFVVQSGGKVALRSEPGRGTTIEIFLPEVAEARQPVAVSPAGPEAARGDETILVVEDEAAVAAASFQVLSRNGYRVLLADSGESAIGLLRGHTGRIALMLVDMILPDIRGPQLVEVARAVHPESAALFASGHSAEAIGRRGEVAPGMELIEKPYEPTELLRRVREAIDTRAPSRT
ncbi:MAG: PAS domain S-box protein [Candidatus Limnocylindrales bacterium]